MKRNILRMFVMLALFSLICCLEAAAEDGGTWGSGNLTWSYENGVVTISGTGNMSFTGITTTTVETRSDGPWMKYRKSITSLVIEEGVTSISRGAFAGCTYLNSVSLPNSLVTIEGIVFKGCDSLTRIEIPVSVNQMGNLGCPIQEATIAKASLARAFSSSSSIDITLLYTGDSSIPESACSGLTNIREITIPEGITSIGASAFEGCTSLRNVTISDSVVSIGESAFKGCSNLKSLVLPDNIGSITFSV